MRQLFHQIFFVTPIQVDTIEIHAHRAVLASASSYWFELFEGLPRTESIITHKLNGGFDKDALEALVEYAYTAKLHILHSQVSFNLVCP